MALASCQCAVQFPRGDPALPVGVFKDILISDAPELAAKTETRFPQATAKLESWLPISHIQVFSYINALQ